MAGILTLLYGVICYAVFLGAFLYAIAFTANAGVARSIDVGPSAPTAIAVVIDLALLSLFAVQHSGMARVGFKRWVTRSLPASVERSTFVLLSSLVLILLYWQWRPLPATVWHVESEPFRIALWALFALGWLLVLSGTFLIDHFELFGLRQVWLRFRGIAYTPPTFVRRGYYNVVRHPLMLGFIIAFWATPDMTVGHLLFALMTTAYILLALQLEERDLIAAHGEAYRSYRREVPMLIPGLHAKSAPKPAPPSGHVRRRAPR